MMGAIRHSENWRGLMAALALLVLGIQLIAPSGFMPVRTEQGVVVTLCTGAGAINVLVDQDRAPEKKHGQDEGAPVQQHCAFAASVQPVVPPLILADLPLPAWQIGAGPIAFALKTGLVARLAAPPPPSSGPPATY
ncbi:MAG TPA: DUF2946 family protein [Rhizorhapis sp.]|nr:DUF2946 family protein [Sphingobium sp.]HKX36083.1 DUF2946 family protein [Rhizorhapis sp.]